MFRKLPVYFYFEKLFFFPMHLWAAKYSCISFWNDWETISRWHTLHHHSGKAFGHKAKVGRSLTNHLNPSPGHETPTIPSSLQRHLSLKEPWGKCWKKRKYYLFSTCWRMHVIWNSRCQTNVLFTTNVYGGRRGQYGEAFWLGAAGLWLLHKPRGSADTAQEKGND